MPLSQSQGEALTTLLGTIRPGWNAAGIRAALKKASPLGSAAEVAVAACRCAANPDMRTPALIADPGPHWHGLAAGSRLAPQMCTEHPAHKAGGCVECVAAAVPRPEGFAAPKRDKSARGWSPKPDDLTADPGELQSVRDRMDAEATS